MQVIGAKEAILSLKNIGLKVQENARKTMHRASDRIVVRAKKMAPVDTHNLENHIHKNVEYEGPKGRLKISVDVDAVGDLADYAVIMHEGEYNLGPLSQAKNDSQPEAVGNRFLTRAADEEEKKLKPAMIAAITEVIT
jgi:hypothetical protein